MKNLYLILPFLFLQCKNKEIKNEPTNISEKDIATQLYKKSLNEKNNEVAINNDTLSKIVYKDGKIKEIIIVKDSLDAQELHLSFYENGNLESKGLQGIVGNKDVNTGISVATWFYYDTKKNLDSTIYYKNAEFGKDFIEKKRFYKNGGIKAIEKYNNYVLYENSIDSIGEWKYYNENGKLLKTINY